MYKSIDKIKKYDRDIVIVERTDTARNGDIVVAMNDENEVETYEETILYPCLIYM